MFEKQKGSVLEGNEPERRDWRGTGLTSRVLSRPVVSNSCNP